MVGNPSVSSESSKDLTLLKSGSLQSFLVSPFSAFHHLGIQYSTHVPRSLAIYYCSSFWKISPLCYVLDVLWFLSPSFPPCGPPWDLLVAASSHLSNAIKTWVYVCKCVCVCACAYLRSRPWLQYLMAWILISALYLLVCVTLAKLLNIFRVVSSPIKCEYGTSYRVGLLWGYHEKIHVKWLAHFWHNSIVVNAGVFGLLAFLPKSHYHLGKRQCSLEFPNLVPTREPCLL